jgi:type 2 lantibiotic biosynthesis protein LanM
MASDSDASNFDAPLSSLAAPALGELAAGLAGLSGLSTQEAGAIERAVRHSLLDVLNAKLSRLLVLELHAARVTGRLTATDSAARWNEFIHWACQPEFWAEQEQNYPALAPRLGRVLSRRIDSALAMARHLVADRKELDALAGLSLGPLQTLSLGAGDSHDGGKTVAVLVFEAGRVVYKPRSVLVDQRLAECVDELAALHPGGTLMRVPRVLERGDHGWAEFIEHRHAQGPDELRSFYLGVGHWLALMRLLSGSDLHAENLIAHGPQPVVVDCETLFTPRVPSPPSGLGAAADRAAGLVSGTVLNVGLLPGRGQALGWRGVDNSALGALPGQQPQVLQPQILKAGTDEAHIGQVLVDAPPAQNHPSPRPALAEHWPDVLQGFESLSATLLQLDARQDLAARLARFKDCRVRVVTRATESYAELARMLWHPVSLRKEGQAREKAESLLRRMGQHTGLAPDSPAVVAAEVQDLMDGDVPVFETRVREGSLHGPGGTRWLPAQDLADAALLHWRHADLRLDHHVIRAALVSAFINDGWMPAEETLRVPDPVGTALDLRRRRQAAAIVRELLATAIRGDDDTVAWIAPVLGPTGWAVQPLEQDVYGGASGVALLVAAYLREQQAGRADAVEGLQDLLRALLNTLRLAQDKRQSERLKTKKPRPPAPGAYIGLGSEIWALLQLHEWRLVGGEAIERACAMAEWLPEAAQADELNDLLTGQAGAIVPLLLLAQRCAAPRYLALAQDIGDALLARATRQGGRAFWAHAHWPEGIGGFAHGTTGMAWVLSRLAQASGQPRFADMAQAALAFDDALFDEGEQNWLDLRMLEGAKTAAAWCHGAVGIGLAALDRCPALDQPAEAERVRRAAAAVRRLGLGWNHSLCHGDASCHELLLQALDAGVAPDGVTRDGLLAEFLSSLEQHGPVCGIARDVFVPGLMPGLGGVAYQLLRFHPQSDLPCLLLPGAGLWRRSP